MVAKVWQINREFHWHWGTLDVAIAKNSWNSHAILCYRFAKVRLGYLDVAIAKKMRNSHAICHIFATMFCQWNSRKTVAKIFGQWNSGCTNVIRSSAQKPRRPGKKIKQASLNGKFPFPASFWLIFWLGIRSNLKPIEIARSCLKFFSNSFLEPSEFSQNSALFNLAFSWWNL